MTEPVEFEKPATPRLAMVELADALGTKLHDADTSKPFLELETAIPRGPVVTLRVQPCIAGPSENRRVILGATVTMHQFVFDLSEGRETMQQLRSFIQAQREGAQQAVHIFGMALSLSWPPEALESALVV